MAIGYYAAPSLVLRNAFGLVGGHATRHVPPQIKDDLIVLDMFVVERLNLLAK